MGAVFGKFEGNGFADTTRGTGNNGYFIL